MKDAWWAIKAEELLGYANQYFTKQFLSGLKAVYGPPSSAMTPIRATLLLTEKSQILERWTAPFRQLLNKTSAVKDQAIHDIPQRPLIHTLDDPPMKDQAIQDIPQRPLIHTLDDPPMKDQAIQDIPQRPLIHTLDDPPMKDQAIQDIPQQAANDCTPVAHGTAQIQMTQSGLTEAGGGRKAACTQPVFRRCRLYVALLYFVSIFQLCDGFQQQKVAVVSVSVEEQNQRVTDIRRECHTFILNHPPLYTNHSHCPPVWDTLMCWPQTRAGTVAVQPCPDYIDKFKLDQNASRTCLSDGTWYVSPDTLTPWTNFTACVVNSTSPPSVSNLIRVSDIRVKDTTGVYMAGSERFGGI
ncbi:hypothetical protein ACOMHN_054537 [Nucella lapillus]